MGDNEETQQEADAGLFGSPVDLRRLLYLRHPAARVRYDGREIGAPTLADVLSQPLQQQQR